MPAESNSSANKIEQGETVINSLKATETKKRPLFNSGKSAGKTLTELP